MTPLVFDCFTFATELDLLGFRMDLLSDVVDHFVVVEAPRTHSGFDKPMYFSENKDRFSTHLDKVIHVVVDDLPAPHPDRWVPERFQRDAILRGLGSAKPDDLILVTDADEIPDPDAITRLKEETFSTAALEMRSCYFYANWQTAGAWPAARAAVRRSLDTPDQLRAHAPLLTVRDAGCHFSYLMSAEAIGRKYRWFAHAELDQPLERAPSYLSAMRDLGIVAHTGEVLEVRQHQSLSSVQRALFDRSPEFFAFEPPAGPLRTAGKKWRGLRTRKAIPGVCVSAIDSAMQHVGRRSRVQGQWS